MQRSRFSNMLVAAVMLLAVAGSPALAENDPAAEVRETLEAWTDDFNAKRADKVCGLFAEDVVADFRGQPERNYRQLCDLLKQSLADRARDFHYDLEILEIIPAGDFAVVRLVWTLTVLPLNVSSAERGMDIFRRQPDGSWKIIRYIAYEAPQ